VSFLKKYLKDHRIDIVSIQETKMENIKDGFLLALSTSITNWIVKPSLDNSGGILVGINTSLFSILQVWKLNFSISILLQNKTKDFTWLITFIYGLVLPSQKNLFFKN
jgi:hypothetical protein